MSDGCGMMGEMLRFARNERVAFVAFPAISGLLRRFISLRFS
jgi:hypothetical protein